MKKPRKTRIRFWQKRSVFTTTFLLLSVLSLFTAVVMFVFTNWIVTRNQTERLQELNANQLSRAEDDMDTRLEMLEQSMSQLLASSDFISIMVNPGQVDSDRTARIVSALAGCVSQNSLVEEAYLYLPTAEEVYSSTGDYTEKENFDNAAEIEQYLSLRTEGRDGGEESVSLLFYTGGRLLIGTDFCVPNFIGAVLFSIDLGEMAQILQGQDADSSGYFLIFDEEGQRIVGDEEAAATAMQSVSDGIYQNVDEESEEIVSESVFLCASSFSGLRYVLYVDPASSRVDYQAVVWMLLPFLLLYAALAEAFSLYITRSIYRPINRLMQITAGKREELDEVNSGRSRNELVYLEKAFQDTLDENTQHKELLASISRDVAEQTFRSVLNGRTMSSEYIVSTLQGIGWQEYLHGRYMALAGRLILDPERELTSVEIGLYKRSLVDLLDELKGDNYIITPFFQDKELLAVILCFREDSSVIHMKQCVTECVKAVDRFTETLPYSVAFGKGRVYNDISSLRFSWQEAVEEVQYMFYLSEAPESEPPALDQMSDDYDKRYFMERSHQVAEAAEKERREDAEKMAVSLIEEIASCSPENRTQYGELAVDVMVEKMIDSHISSEEIEEMKISQMMERFSVTEETEEIREALEAFFLQAIRKIHNYSRKSRYKYVDTAKEYIADHYSDGNLSLNEVSEAIGISAPYLSGVFNEINQGSFSSYLKNYRITQAKNFLEQTTQSVAEIGYKCGFNSAQSFSRAFRKEPGFSPGKYREYRMEKKRQEGIHEKNEE
ncbi:MAG: AraC family transcriptional regulator [Lachnospiraceae bacterium]|nr:AraC family transcriptional regulator [Lachnospiraceae bacterium]